MATPSEHEAGAPGHPRMTSGPGNRATGTTPSWESSPRSPDRQREEGQASGERDGDWRWAHLLTRNQAGWDRVGRDAPVYALPEAARNALTASARAVSGRHRRKKPLLTEAEAAAEKAFLTLCREYAADVVGVWDGCPVHYPPLDPPSPPVLSPALFQRLGWGQDRTPAGVNAALSQRMRCAGPAP